MLTEHADCRACGAPAATKPGTTHAKTSDDTCENPIHRLTLLLISPSLAALGVTSILLALLTPFTPSSPSPSLTPSLPSSSSPPLVLSCLNSPPAVPQCPRPSPPCPSLPPASAPPQHPHHPIPAAPLTHLQHHPAIIRTPTHRRDHVGSESMTKYRSSI